MPRGPSRARSRALAVIAGTTALVVGVLAGSSAANAEASGAGLGGNGSVRGVPLDGSVVGVVAWSAPVDGRVAFVVANSSGEPVRVRKVVATATAASGASSVRASTRSVVPRVLEPAAQGVGSIRFDPETVRFDDTFAFDVRTATIREKDPVGLATGSFVLSPPRTGDVAQTLDLAVTNDTTRAIDGRVKVRVVCLNEAGIPTVSASTSLRGTKLRPGATTPASVDFELLCPVYVVGAEGAPAR